LKGNKNENNQPPVVIDNNQPPVVVDSRFIGYYPPEDEIDLVDLWGVLVKRKKTLFGVTGATTLCALLYALLATPVYRAEATFMPPTVSDIQALNIPGVQSINTGSTYIKFQRNLNSIIPRETIFAEMNLLDQFEPDREPDESIDEIFSEFNETLTITTPKAEKDKTPIPTITFAMEWEDPVLIAQVVNRIATEAERVTAIELISDIQTRISARVKDLKLEIQLLREKTEKKRLDEIERLKMADALDRKTINDKIASLRSKASNERLAEISRLEEADQIKREGIEEKISTLRNSAKEKRLDRISTLKEASEIAHSLEILDPIGYKLRKIGDSNAIKSQILTDFSNRTPELYTRGYEALDAEVTSLSNRKIDDPFIKELRGLQDRLQQLKYNEKIAVLKVRNSDDPFIPELRGLQEKLKLLEYNRKVEQLISRKNDDPYIKSLRDKENDLARLESINIDPATVKTARLDQAAYPPDKRIKPKRRLIVVLGLMLGLMLGVFAAFFFNFLENQRKLPAAV